MIPKQNLTALRAQLPMIDPYRMAHTRTPVAEFEENFLLYRGSYAVAVSIVPQHSTCPGYAGLYLAMK